MIMRYALIVGTNWAPTSVELIYISPYNFKTLPHKQVMRIDMLIKWKVLSQYYNKFSSITYKEVCSTENKELNQILGG